MSSNNQRNKEYGVGMYERLRHIEFKWYKILAKVYSTVFGEKKKGENGHHYRTVPGIPPIFIFVNGVLASFVHYLAAKLLFFVHVNFDKFIN